MSEQHSSSLYQWGAVALLVLGIAAEVPRLFLDATWGRFGPILSHGESILVATIWAAAAVTLPLRDRNGALANAAWILSLAAPAAMVLHAVLTVALSGVHYGLAYVAGAALLSFLLKRTWDGRDFDRARHA